MKRFFFSFFEALQSDIRHTQGLSFFVSPYLFSLGFFCSFVFSFFQNPFLFAALLFLVLCLSFWFFMRRDATFMGRRHGVFLLFLFGVGACYGVGYQYKNPYVALEKGGYDHVSGKIMRVHYKGKRGYMTLRVKGDDIFQKDNRDILNDKKSFDSKNIFHQNKKTSHFILLVFSKKYQSQLKEGNDVSLKVRLNPLRPHYFIRGDHIAFFDKVEGISAYGFVIKIIHVDGKVSFLPHMRSLVRSKIITIIQNQKHNNLVATKALEEGAKGLAISIATGDREYLSSSTKKMIRQTGVAHILAIAGLHFGLFAFCVFIFVRWFLCLLCKERVALYGKKIGVLLSFCACVFYMWIIVPSVAAERAFVMISLVFLAVLLGKRSITMHNVTLAAWILILMNPINIFNVGFVLSFSCVIGLVAFYEGEYAYKMRTMIQSLRGGRLLYSIWVLFATSFVAWLVTIPLTIYYFNAFSLYSLLTNIIVVPLMAWGIMPFVFALFVSLLGPSWFAVFVGKALVYTCYAIVWCVNKISHFPFSYMHMSFMPTWIFICFLCLFLIFCFYKSLRKTSLVGMLMLSVFYLCEPTSFMWGDDKGHIVWKEDQILYSTPDVNRRLAFVRKIEERTGNILKHSDNVDKCSVEDVFRHGKKLTFVENCFLSLRGKHIAIIMGSLSGELCSQDIIIAPYYYMNPSFCHQDGRKTPLLIDRHFMERYHGFALVSSYFIKEIDLMPHP